MNKQRMMAWVVGALVGVLAGSSVAVGDDDKTYPGLMCQPGDDPDGQLTYTQSGEIYLNAGTYSTRNVVCPVVRDHTSNSDGVWDWLVRMNDGSSTSGVTCTLYAWNRYGVVDDSLTLATTSGTGDFEHATWGYLSSSSANGTYGMVCTLPTNSAIYGYRVIEHEQTD